MQVIRFADLAATPWKNGGGITRQLLIQPPAANLDNFTLRISIADVDSDGPFSDFSGIDRTLGLLSGSGLCLLENGQPLTTLQPGGELYVFDGGRAISSQRLAGKVQDFNVMTRRGAASHQATRLSLQDEQALHTSGPALLLLAEGEALQVTGSGDQQSLGRWDALWLDGATELQLQPAGNCSLILVAVQPA